MRFIISKNEFIESGKNMLEIKDYFKAGEVPISNLILEHYQKIGLTDEEFLFWLQLLRLQSKGDFFPDLAEIGRVMGKSVDTIYKLLNQLVSRGFLLIETHQNHQGKMMDTYDLTPIFDKISLLKNQQKMQKQKQDSKEVVKKLFQSFEKEFGRQLSPIELESINSWLEEDHYSPELIYLALREAVLNQAYSLKYIDRILLSWERKNIRTKEQVAEDQNKRKQVLRQKEILKQQLQEEAPPKIVLHNWLDIDNLE